MKRGKLVRHLRNHGCVLIREGGRHAIWANPGKNKKSAVPRHLEIHNVMASKICKDLQIPKP